MHDYMYRHVCFVPLLTCLLAVCHCLFVMTCQVMHGVCRLPDEDARGSAQHFQIRTWQDLCSSWLILHKVHPVSEHIDLQIELALHDDAASLSDIACIAQRTY